ncbi:MAG: FtsW/RodA/SpoVE family cell cycle protein [Bacteroidales bacterium]|nr:FtsW/RodA/SpoVE family cell cycle protein [Bacteroidales bacterium]
MMDNIKKYVKGDMVIWGVVIGLFLFSLLAVYSATDTLSYSKFGGNSGSVVVRHLSFIFAGLIIMFFVHLLPTTVYRALSTWMIFLIIPLLLITLLFGVSINQASRWMEIPGIGITIQTSDIAKVVAMMFLAKGLSVRQNQIQDFRKGFIPVIWPVLIVCALIMPANLSTAVLLFISATVLMFVGQVKVKHLSVLYLACILLISVFMGTGILLKKMDMGDNPITQRVDTWINRIENFSNDKTDSRGADFQSEQGKIAIASGGIVGKGPGNSNQRVMLPQSYNDFIYAIIIEEYGFVGGAILLMLYLTLLFRAGMLVQRSDRLFPSLLAMGLTIILVFQAMINMAVVVGIVPVTGQPLPLVSMGGSSLLVTSAAIGVILGVSKELKRPDQTQDKTTPEGPSELETQFAQPGNQYS